MSGNVARMSAELGGMTDRKARERIVPRVRSIEDLLDRSNIGAAKQPINAELSADLC